MLHLEAKSPEPRFVNLTVNGLNRRVDIDQLHRVFNNDWYSVFKNLLDIGVSDIDFLFGMDLAGGQNLLLLEMAQTMIPGVDTIKIEGSDIPLVWDVNDYAVEVA